MITEWHLPDDLSAAARARERVAQELEQRGLSGDAVDDAVLIASELAANAVRHGQPPALLRIEYLSGAIRVSVVNEHSVGDPEFLAVAPDSNHGRGLAIVAQLAQDCGWSREGHRLEVWAELPLSPGSGPTR